MTQIQWIGTANIMFFGTFTNSISTYNFTSSYWPIFNNDAAAGLYVFWFWFYTMGVWRWRWTTDWSFEGSAFTFEVWNPENKGALLRKFVKYHRPSKCFQQRGFDKLKSEIQTNFVFEYKCPDLQDLLCIAHIRG